MGFVFFLFFHVNRYIQRMGKADLFSREVLTTKKYFK